MGASASVASGDPLVSEEKVKKHLGVLYDEEAKTAFQQSRRGSTRARKTRLLSWAGKGSRKRLSERGFVFFSNLYYEVHSKNNSFVDNLYDYQCAFYILN